ncbi:MAG: hypothetical protein ACR2ME_11515 [Acidimicrobiia bacterium]
MPLLVSALVVGWAAWFGMAVLDSGPEWAIRHLRVALPILGAVAVVALVALAWVRPLWAPIGIAYPALVGLVLGVGRSRQMMRVQQTGGFGEIDSAMKGRLFDRYRRGLLVTAVLTGVMGALIVGAGFWQGTILVALGLLMLLVRQRAKASA